MCLTLPPNVLCSTPNLQENQTNALVRRRLNCSKQSHVHHLVHKTSNSYRSFLGLEWYDQHYMSSSFWTKCGAGDRYQWLIFSRGCKVSRFINKNYSYSIDEWYWWHSRLGSSLFQSDVKVLRMWYIPMLPCVWDCNMTGNTMKNICSNVNDWYSTLYW